MGLLDEFKQPPVKRWPCAVRKVSEGLEKADAEILVAAVMSEEWPIKTLSQSLKTKGIVLGETPIKAHRSKACSCWAADA
jgi:hypothetical protein